MSTNMLIENNTAHSAQMSAFNFLKDLPSRFPQERISMQEDERSSEIIEMDVAQSYTDFFRITKDAFSIPVSWSMTKEALVNLLGITSHVGYQAITGVRFYAGINAERQLTLIAVSTEADANEPERNNDLTINDQYPYYDFADPCPSHCSNVGNLRLMNNFPERMEFIRTREK